MEHAVCNHCEQISRMKPSIKRLRHKVKKHYFQCEHCSHVYTIGYTDEHIDRERKRIRKLQVKNNNGLYDKKIKDKKELIESMMASLRYKIEQ